MNIYFRYILWNNEHGWTIGDSSSLTNSEQYFLSGHEGWKYFADRGRFFKYFTSPVTRWTAVRSFCQVISPGNNGELASVPDRATNSFLATLMTKNQKAWIGGYKNQSGQWQWSDGTVWNFTNWAPDQPDNSHGQEDSLVFNFAAWTSHGKGKWNDANGVGAKEFICQYQGQGMFPLTQQKKHFEANMFRRHRYASSSVCQGIQP